MEVLIVKCNEENVIINKQKLNKVPLSQINRSKFVRINSRQKTV